VAQDSFVFQRGVLASGAGGERMDGRRAGAPGFEGIYPFGVKGQTAFGAFVCIGLLPETQKHDDRCL
jgi:hypothetical protein